MGAKKIGHRDAEKEKSRDGGRTVGKGKGREGNLQRGRTKLGGRRGIPGGPETESQLKRKKGKGSGKTGRRSNLQTKTNHKKDATGRGVNPVRGG